MLRAALAWFLLVGVAPARADEAPSVAVLPLQKAAASAQYDGLGRALAGMVVSDLASVPGLRLVERDQLDALLAEMKLGETAFVDPKTAQKLGAGVGARFVVLGGFSVIEPTFALDARIVEVRSGEIVKAADAHGTVADFVAVEKELIEALVLGLDLTLTASDRRKLMVQAPTERFSAFTAYGEGLARADEGKLDDAKVAFGRAVAEDPQFAEAHAALGELEALVRQRQAERAGSQRTARDEAFTAVLASVPDIRKVPADVVYDQQAVANLALRLAVLEEQRRDCDRYAEMRSYLGRVRWTIAEPPKKPTDIGVLSYAIGQLAKAKGLDGSATPPGLPGHLTGSLPSRIAPVFRNTPTFVLEGYDRYHPTDGHGLLSALLACKPPTEALREIDGLIADARAAGVAGQPWSHYLKDLTLDDALQVAWMNTQAEALGSTAELTRRSQALMAAHHGRPEEGKVLAMVDDVLDVAREWEDHRVRRRGLAADEIVRRMRLIVDSQVAPTPVCKQALNQRLGAVNWVSRYDQGPTTSTDWSRTRQRMLDDAFSSWAAASDFGCFEGVPPRFSTPTEAWAWFDSARSRATPTQDPDCPGAWANFEQTLEQTRSQRQDPAVGPVWLFTVDTMWLNIVYQRCATE